MKPVSIAREAKLTNQICARGFYKFGHLSFYPTSNATHDIKYIHIAHDHLRVRDSTGIYDWLGTVDELFELQLKA